MADIKNLLLVDDDLDYRFFFSRALERVDGSVVLSAAIDGREALAKLPVVLPDLIVLDYNMPGINGKSFLREVLKKGLKVPVIIYSTFMNMIDRNELMDLGATHVFTKPVSQADTEAMIAGLLGLALHNRAA
jgi:CheY-like chemotaxis protein